MQNATVTLSCKRIHAAVQCKFDSLSLSLFTSFTGFLFQTIVFTSILFALQHRKQPQLVKRNSKTSIRKICFSLCWFRGSLVSTWEEMRKKNMRTGRSSQRAKMNNYCTGTDFMKWNESFAVILAIIMWRWNAKTLAKNMSTNMYLLYQVSSLQNATVFMRQNKTIHKSKWCFLSRYYASNLLFAKCTVSMVTFRECAHALSAHKVLIDALVENICTEYSMLAVGSKIFSNWERKNDEHNKATETHSCRMHDFMFRKCIFLLYILFLNVLSVIDTHNNVGRNSAKANFQDMHNVWES